LEYGIFFATVRHDQHDQRMLYKLLVSSQKAISHGQSVSFSPYSHN
jgi:hypothetical protein